MAGVSYHSVLFLKKFLFIVEIVLFVCSCMLVRARLCTFVLVPRSSCRSPGDGREGRSSSTALARDGLFLPQGTVEGWLEDRGCFPRVRWSPSTLPCHLQRRAGLQGFFASRGHPSLVEYYQCSQLYVFASFCLTPTQLEEILLWFARLVDGQISICTYS